MGIHESRTMSDTQELNYDEPWPMYSDEDEPWKDLERLLKLREKMDTQAEMGDALGCTPATISYWLQKARDEVDPDHDLEELQCLYFNVCGNLMAGPKVGVCTVCLDLTRYNDSNGRIDPDDSDDLEEHMEKLHDEYDGFAKQRQEDYIDWHSEEDDDKDSETED